MSQERFEQGAATWDEHPGRVQNAQAVAEAVGRAVPLSPEMTLVDYGAGTGLVTLALAPNVGRVIAIDSAPAMLAVLAAKAEAAGMRGVETLCLDLAAGDAPELQADLLVSAMVLHHVEEVPAVLRGMAALLREGGYIALADLDIEDGSFHEDATGVFHRGFDRTWVADCLAAAGFVDVEAETANAIERPSGRYTVFLAHGRKQTN